MRLAFAVAFGVPVRRCPGKKQRCLWRPALARRSRELLPPEESLRRAKKRGGSSSAAGRPVGGGLHRQPLLALRLGEPRGLLACLAPRGLELGELRLQL